MARVPDTLREILEPETLAALDEALGPRKDTRPAGRYEVEIEASGEGTFTLTLDDGAISAKKGYAKGDPFLSCEIPKGGFALVRAVLDAAAQGFPDAPQLAERQRRLRALSRAEQEALAKGIAKLDDVIVAFAVRGVGTFRVARGALDECTRELTLSLDQTLVDKALAGEPLEGLAAAVKVAGDRGLVAELLAALMPVTSKLRR